MKKSLDAKLSLIPQGSKSQKTGKKNDETEPDFEKRFRAFSDTLSSVLKENEANGNIKYNTKEKGLTFLQRAMVKAYEASYGRVTLACKAVGISRITHYKWMKITSYAEAIAAAEVSEFDYVKTAFLREIGKGSMTGLIFWLKTKGRQHGWPTERVEKKVVREGFDFSIFSKEEMVKIDAILDAKLDKGEGDPK